MTLSTPKPVMLFLSILRWLWLSSVLISIEAFITFHRHPARVVAGLYVHHSRHFGSMRRRNTPYDNDNDSNNDDDNPLTKKKRSSGGGGGRAPGQRDKVSEMVDDRNSGWCPTPCSAQEARLTVIQITDVYTLEHLASVKTLVEETRAKSIGSNVICMVTVRAPHPRRHFRLFLKMLLLFVT
jgi:hypothetical protein